MPKLPPIEPRYVSPREAARRTGVSRSRIYELLKSREIDAYKDGSRTLISVASLDAWSDRREPWRGSVRERAGIPDFAGLFLDHLRRLTPSLGEGEARARALAAAVRAYRRHHECAYKPAAAAVRALIEPADWVHE